MPSLYQTVFGGNAVAPAIPTYLALNISANVILGWPLESNITAPAAAEIIDVTATVPGLTIQLSDARQVGTGYCALFNNVGANSFTLLDAQGNTLMAPAPGQAWQLYISDNSTLQGTWRVFQYGASVSTANAATLAGSGLKAISTTLNERIVINQQSSNYAILNTDRASCVEWTGGSGGTFTAPTPAVVGSDWFCYIKNSGTGVLTLSGTIDGSAGKTLNPNDSCILVSDGTNLFTMGFGQSIASSFNFVTISLTPPGTGTVVLSGAQLNRVSYKFTGALTGNVIVQVPASIQQYWVDNETTGAFTLTVSAGGAGATFAVPQGTRVILYCDGLNIVNAVSSGAGSVTLVADGSAGAPGLAWASDTSMGFYRIGPSILGFSTAGTARGSINATGQWAINTPTGGVDALDINVSNGAFSATSNPAFRVLNSNASAQTPMDFLSAGVLSGRIRNDFTGAMTYVTFSTGVHAFFTSGDSGVGSKIFQVSPSAPFLSGLGTTAAALVDMTPDTGTFTGVGVGFTAGTNFACTWSRIGKLVLLSIGGNIGVSNATTFTITGLPAVIQPATLAQAVPIGIARNNGADTSGAYALIIGSSAIQLGLSGSLVGWAGAGNKGFGNTVTVAYLLN